MCHDMMKLIEIASGAVAWSEKLTAAQQTCCPIRGIRLTAQLTQLGKAVGKALGKAWKAMESCSDCLSAQWEHLEVER